MIMDGNRHEFDPHLCIECAEALAHTSGLGCMVTEVNGSVIYSSGFSCDKCSMCEKLGIPDEIRMEAQQYATASAERFGGKYEYFCPGGLTQFTSPIFGDNGVVASITVGPILMIERGDYIKYDLLDAHNLSGDELEDCKKVLNNVPSMDAKRVYYISNMLFMSAGFINNVSAASRMVEAQMENEIQGQIGDYILRLKSSVAEYPYEAEKELMHSISTSNRKEAQRLMNLLLGNILLASGGDRKSVV